MVYIVKFCVHCGNTIDSTCQFCPECGKCVISSTSSSTSSSSNPLTYEEFRKKKSAQRTSHFLPKKHKQDKRVVEEVFINVGVITGENGNVKVTRGSIIPLKVNVDLSAREVKKLAF